MCTITLDLSHRSPQLSNALAGVLCIAPSTVVVALGAASGALPIEGGVTC
jgi:hypothetical protein